MARSRLIVGRLPWFSLAWLWSTLVWTAVLAVESRLPAVPFLVAVLLQGSILLATTLAARAARDPRWVVPVVVAGCAAAGAATIGTFAAAGGAADYLAFVLLTLYLASSLFFAWGWLPALVLLLATVVPWLGVVPRLPVHVPYAELVGAILAGSSLALAIAEGLARSFARAVRHGREREAVHARERAARADAERARAGAEDATRTKERFLAVVSHELRSPLTGVLHATHALRGALREGPAERAEATLDTIERSARAAARLIDDLLDVSRGAEGRLRLERRDVDLRSIVASAAESVDLAARARGVAVTFDLAAEPVPVRADPGRIRQVVDNLVGNALKFTPSGGRVAVSLAVEDAEAVLTVEDTGVGLAPAALARLFEPFWQGERREGGLGLGLAIARQLVEAHGGSISAASAGPERGATFRVRLPLVSSV